MATKTSDEKRAASRKTTTARKAGAKVSKAEKLADKDGDKKITLLNNKGRKMTGPEAVKVQRKAGPDYTLMKDIKSSPMYGRTGRDPFARQILEDNCEKAPRNRIVPGQLVLFEYFEPKTKEQLEYYDASPCTIFFGVFNSKEGKRILGFNIHYYPPKLRYAIMDKIFKIYKPVLSKYFTTGTTKEIDAFDYQYLVENLRKAKLDFGVREYIPSLIGKSYLIPPNQWQVAVFTEGWFKKETRAQIMRYWKKRMPAKI